MKNKRLGRYAKLRENMLKNERDRKEMELTHKQIMKFKDGEISLCKNCYCMTKSMLKDDILYCLKCEGIK